MICLAEFALKFTNIWPTIFAIDLFRYLIAAGTLATILAVFATSLRRRRIQRRLVVGADMRREIFFSLLTVLIFSPVGFGVFVGSQSGIFKVYDGSLPPALRLLFEVSVIIVLHDAYFYWAHRAMHHPWLFRRFHRIHHKSRTPTPWAAYAFAPLEAIVETGILPLAALIIPMHQLTVFIFVTHMIVRNVIGHAGHELFPRWWLRMPVVRLITTTMHHDLHHSSGRHNFGLYFTWWDRLCGTEHPEYRERFEAVVGNASAEKMPVLASN